MNSRTVQSSTHLQIKTKSAPLHHTYDMTQLMMTMSPKQLIDQNQSYTFRSVAAIDDHHQARQVPEDNHWRHS